MLTNAFSLSAEARLITRIVEQVIGHEARAICLKNVDRLIKYWRLTVKPASTAP
jgi:hypothetical protein